MLVVVRDNIVKNIGNFEGKIEASVSSATVIERDGYFNFTRGLAHCSDNGPINTDRFVIGGFVIQITIEITEMVLKRGMDKAIA